MYLKVQPITNLLSKILSKDSLDNKEEEQVTLS